LYDHGLLLSELVRKSEGWFGLYAGEPLYSITDVARKISREELPKVLPAINRNIRPMTEETYPNLITMDDICDNKLARIVMDVIGKIIHDQDVTLDLNNPREPVPGNWRWVSA